MDRIGWLNRTPIGRGRSADVDDVGGYLVPRNMMLGPDGPVVFDWSTAAPCPPGSRLTDRNVRPEKAERTTSRWRASVPARTPARQPSDSYAAASRLAPRVSPTVPSPILFIT